MVGRDYARILTGRLAGHVAINKKQSALWVKATIIIVILAFVVTAIPVIFTGGGNAQQSAESAAGDVLARVASQYAPTISSFSAVLASEPTSYTALVAVGDTYFDWALAVRSEMGQTNVGGYDLPMWHSAIAHYERALAVDPGEPGVMTDLAISYYYGERLDDAIAMVEQVMAESPDFAPAYFNAGIFYRTIGDSAAALAALQRHVEMAPDAQTATTARNWIADLQAEGSSATETVTP